MRDAARLSRPELWVGLLFIGLLLRMDALRPVFRWAFPGIAPVIYDRASFLELFLAHLTLVAIASIAASLVGLALAIFVTRPAGSQFRTMVDTLAAIGQTFPPVAVLAIAVPLIGFGARPTVIALFVYGLLPIIENAVAGLEGVPDNVREAADGMGLSSRQRLLRSRITARSTCHPRWNSRLGHDRDRHRDDRLDCRRPDPRHADFRRAGCRQSAFCDRRVRCSLRCSRS